MITGLRPISMSLLHAALVQSAKISPEKHEVCSAGYDPLISKGLAKREASRAASFFVPYLKPEMHVLDCGCGPGGISVTLVVLVPNLLPS